MSTRRRTALQHPCTVYGWQLWEWSQSVGITRRNYPHGDESDHRESAGHRYRQLAEESRIPPTGKWPPCHRRNLPEISESSESLYQQSFIPFPGWSAQVFSTEFAGGPPEPGPTHFEHTHRNGLLKSVCLSLAGTFSRSDEKSNLVNFRNSEIQKERKQHERTRKCFPPKSHWLGRFFLQCLCYRLFSEFFLHSSHERLLATPELNAGARRRFSWFFLNF